MPNAIPAVELLEAFGVNIHMAYTNTAYENSAMVLALLKALHVRHVRDGFFPWPAGHTQYDIHASLKALGIKAIACIPYSPTLEVGQLVEFATLAGNIEAFEVTNEPDDQANPSWAMQVRAMMPIVSAAAQQLGIPVLAPALVMTQSYQQLGDVSQWAKVANAHAYFGGRNPECAAWGPSQHFTMAFWKAQGLLSVPNATGSIITESGNQVTPKPTAQYTLPPGPAAVYAIRTVLEAFYQGFERCYLYELLDNSGTDYGLCNAAFQAKLSYTAVRHFLEVIADSSTAAKYGPGFLDYTAPNGYHSLLLQKHDGSFWIVAWPTEPCYDEVGLKLTPFQTVNLGFSIQTPGYAIAQADSIGQNANIDQHVYPNLLSVSWIADVGAVLIVKVVRN
jgi:hypothetical protein